MTQRNKMCKRCRHAIMSGAMLVVGLATVSCNGYDLDEREPDNFGASRSIYGYLSEHQGFTTMTRLIDDLDYRDVLDKTGSKTLFAADDEAFSRFFGNNAWGVRSYDQLSLAQKKMLLNGAMINNSYQVQTLSSVEGPLEGQCMRRTSAQSVLDTVTVMTATDMPDNPYWARHKEKGSLVCMTDNSEVPMTHFIEQFMQNNKITNEDYNFLYNYTTERKAGDASVNGVQIAEQNIRCTNGFIHRMADVVAPLPNMAELIAQNPQMSQFNKLLERYCAPYPCGDEITLMYNSLYGTNVDTVYQKRFFADRSQGGRELNELPDGGPVPEASQLKFDPGWNSYYSSDQETDHGLALQKDMAVMMVPTNEAMQEYWENGAGKVLRDLYGTWENVPNKTLTPLITVNMLSSFVGSVPSKFSSILNDAHDPMGVTTESIDHVYQACNGAVYMTNTVFSPTAYVSVMFPAMVNETMNILYWAIEELQYYVYLNSLNSYYSFFLPTNNSLLEYIDPVSYGKSSTQLYQFHYDSKATSNDSKVWATIYDYDPVLGVKGDSIGRAGYYEVRDRLNDILDTHIVIGDVEDGHEYYRTKGGTEIRVRNVALGANGMTVEGSYQVNEGEPLRVSYIYDQSPATNGVGNGKVYILDGQPILGTRHTVYDVLKGHEEYSKFFDLMESSGLFETQHVTGTRSSACGGTNISLFNSYHYTVYVPTNKAIQDLQDAGKLPTWEQVDMYEEAGLTDKKQADSLAIVNFLKYHIQDNAIFANAEGVDADFETSVIDPTTERFYRIHVKSAGTDITITDGAGNQRHVVTTDDQLYNNMAREYQYNSGEVQRATQIETSSSAVVHLIDGVLQIK